MKTVLAVMLLVVSSLCRGANDFGYIFLIEPNPARAGAPIAVSIESTRVQCLPLPDSLEPIFGENNVVHFEVPTSDGCESIPPEKRSYFLDPWPVGSYQVRFFNCGGVDPDTGALLCQTLEQIPLSVFGLATGPRTVPALHVGIGVLLGVVILLVGWGRWKGARC